MIAPILHLERRQLMLSTVQYVNPSPNLQKWELGSQLGAGFENKIFDLISKQLLGYFQQGIRIHQTPASGDGGKDIIIDSSGTPIPMFGMEIGKSDHQAFKVYVECKSSDNEKIRLEKVLGNVTRVKEDSIDFFILVTNTTITPYAYCKFEEELSLYNIRFILIDQHLLNLYLRNCGTVIGTPPPLEKPCMICTEYQVLSGMSDGRNTYEIFIVCRNYTETKKLCSFRLLTDRNWNAEDAKWSSVMEPLSGFSKKITVVRAYNDGISDLLFQLQAGDTECEIHIQTLHAKQMVVPPLVGAERKKCISYFVSELPQNKGLHLYYIWGETGIGKTRILQEIFKELDGTNIDIAFLRSGKKNFLQELERFLKKHGYLSEESTYHTLTEMLRACRHEYRRALLFIDDCHNAKDSLLDALQISIDYLAPVSIIVCGRTDQRAGSTKFYSFVQWTKENKEGFTLSPLTDEETRSLIRIMINKVPEFVLQKIRTSSQNNPLFIIQYIEYLLEANLATIINRNTVGILNVSTFNSKPYIPEGIHEIYTDRLNFLMSQAGGAALQAFLLTLSFMGGAMSMDDVVRFYDEDTSMLEDLISRNFVQIGENGEVRFVHESMFLFFRKRLFAQRKLKKQVAQILLNSKYFLFTKLGELDRGRIFLWDGKRKEARHCFEPSVQQLREIRNFSAVQIDISIYEYLFDILDLYKNDTSETELLKKIFLARIYIALHHYNPVIAVNECSRAIEMVETIKALNGSFGDIKRMLWEQKAHAQINSGYLADGEVILNELQSQWLVSPESWNNSTLFDMFDRLCAIYIKYNCWHLAYNYSRLSQRVADHEDDENLQVMVHRTRSKLYFYSDPQESKKCMLRAKEGSTKRINASNEVSLMIWEMTHDPKCPWGEVEEKAGKLLSLALSKNYPAIIIRLYMVLAVAALKMDERKGSFERTKDFISKGIDSSIQFGIPTYIWQFYNLAAILDMKAKMDCDSAYRSLETVYSLLAKQNLLYLGNLDLCYGNILALSNIGFFLRFNRFETDFYRKLSRLTYKDSLQECDFNCRKPACGYFCSDATEALRKQYVLASQQHLLFTKASPNYLLRDEETGYFIILS